MKFFSHTGVELKVHLRKAAEYSAAFLETFHISNADSLKKAARLIALSHDFGKYTTYFQDRLIHQVPKDQLNSHAFISALFSAFCFMQTDLDSMFALCGYFSVLHHHGALLSYKEDMISPYDLDDVDSLDGIWNDRLTTVDIQIKDILENKSEIENELIENGLQVDLVCFGENYREVLKWLYKIRRQISRDTEKSERLFIYSQLLFSVLIDSDKRDAGGVTVVSRPMLPITMIDDYKRENPFRQTPMSTMREEVYREVVDSIDCSADENIYTLTAPAGSGKTLTALNAALHLKNKRKLHGRIIYALPYTSIIDQNHEDITKVLDATIPDFKSNRSKYIIKHHNLSDMKYVDESQEKPVEEGVLLYEGWESEIIVTTFVQLLETILGYQNKFLKKYHALLESVIILDEVQNIDVKYWNAIAFFINLITRYLNCKVILMTATKPLILPENAVRELLPSYQNHFQNIGRVRLIYHENEVTVQDFCAQIAEICKVGSSMIVLNTIKESIEVYDLLKEYGIDTEYLSSAIIPSDRKVRIDRIKRRLDRKEEFVLVSTQVVEAGVNFDFDRVIRDIGPIDSIIQCCGRANRNMEKARADVHVFRVVNEKGRLYGLPIYGPVSIQVSAKVLSEIINEEDFLSLIEAYYLEVKSRSNLDESEALIKAVWNGMFSSRKCSYRCGNCTLSYLCRFSLIEERHGYIDVFVEKDAKASEILEQYRSKVLYEEDPATKRKNLIQIKASFRGYVISVPVKYTDDCDIIAPQKDNIKVLPYSRLDENYSEETGFNMKGQEGRIF